MPDALFVQRVLARGQQVERLDGLQAALGLRVEQAQGFDLIVEQVHPHRQGLAAGEQVEDGPAHGELAMFHHLGHRSVAGIAQPLAEGIDVQPLAAGELEGAAAHVVRRRQAHQQAGCGDDHHAALKLRQAVQRRQPLRDQILVR